MVKNKTNNKDKSTLILAGVLIEVILLIVCVFLAGGGHGTYIPMKIFFPYTMLSTINNTSISGAFIIIAIIQYPIYGIIVQYAKSEKLKRTRFAIISVIHIIAMILALILGNENFN